MADTERTTETTTTAPVENGATTETVVARHAGTGAKVEMIVYYIIGLLEGLLAIRFVLSLLGANQNNGFAQFIYNLTYPFVAPFFGLFGYTFQYGVARFEFETLVAMAIYSLIGYAIGRLLRIGRA